MPKLSVWFLRASLLHMGLGFLFGSLILHHKGIPIYTWTWLLLNPHIEIMIFGWVIQFVMGMGLWILPRFSGAQRYGNMSLGWASLVLLNMGIALIAVNTQLDSSALMIGGLACKAAAVGLFIVLIWSRVKPLGGFATIPSSHSL